MWQIISLVMNRGMHLMYTQAALTFGPLQMFKRLKHDNLA